MESIPRLTLFLPLAEKHSSVSMSVMLTEESEKLNHSRLFFIQY